MAWLFYVSGIERRSNVGTSRVRETLLPSPYQNHYFTLMSQQQQQHLELSNERQIQLAL